MKRITVVGIGLMGGSLGLALRRCGGWRVTGLARRASTVSEAVRRGALHEGFVNPARALTDADVVVYCSPVDKIVPLARRHRRWIPAGALVMDVGSVKGPLVREMEKLFSGQNQAAFVGAHPMAGSEKTGVANARADLYRGAVCVLAKTPRTNGDRLSQAARFWKSVGAKVLILDPDTHDRAVAMVSHLPHAIADALTLAVGDWAGPAGVRLAKELAAGSYRDATRVAGADPGLWRGIFTLNDRAVRRAVSLFSKKLNGLAQRGWRASDLRRAQRLNAFLKDKP